MLANCTYGIGRDMFSKDEDDPMPSTEPLQDESDAPYDYSPRIYSLSHTPERSTKISVRLRSIHSGVTHSVAALLDSGATGMFIDREFVQRNSLETRPILKPTPVYNVDGTPNRNGSICEEYEAILEIGSHSERVSLAVTSLGGSPMIIGHGWLRKHNPEVNWETGQVMMTRCPSSCREPSSLHISSASQIKAVKAEEEGELMLEPGDGVFAAYLPDENEVAHLRATFSHSQRLAQEAADPTPPKQSFEDLVPKPYRDFEDVFSKDAFDRLPPRKTWDHGIELTPGAEPQSSRTFPLSPLEQKELDNFLQENLRNGRIRPSKSPFGAPVFFIKKKDGSLRLVQDYRKLNTVTIKNSYPLPLISDILNRLRGAKYFTKLDLRWGFNNVRIKEGDEYKAAFRTNRGLYEPLVMFFGLCNSPATFQTMMNDILENLIHQGCTVCFMDDILTFNKTLPEHRQTVREVLGLLRENHLFLKAEKCEFERQKIEYLGLVISENHVSMDPVKVKGVTDWPVPKKVKEVQSFLGFVNFYRRFIKDFSHIARPLHALTRKTTEWRWGEPQQAAFEALKHAITTAPVLVFPSDTGKFRIEADASNFATGAVLSQLQDDGKWHPVGFISKSFSDVERNYEIHDKEMLAIIRALEEWRHFLEGAHERMDIWTDHRNLQYFRTAQRLNRRQARWSLFLSRFDFELHHRPGRSMGKPDALSRRADHPHGTDDNSNITLLTPERFHIQVLNTPARTTLSTSEQDFLDRVRKCKDLDDAVVKALKDLEDNPKSLRSEEWARDKELVTFRGCVYVPQDADLRRDIVAAHHDSAITGHPGRWKTLELVSRNYWWPGISRYVAAYVRGCDACNRTKTFPARPMGMLMPNRVPDRRWQIVSTDLIGELPESKGYNAILVVVDRLSKRIHAVPTTTDVDSLGIARLFRDHVWRNHGLPEEIISDRGTVFISGFSDALGKLLGMKLSPSTAYHPQTDGQTERVNQEIEQFLRLFINHRQDDWSEWLPLAEFSYNNRVHAATRRTPFELDSGQHPRLGTEPRRETRVEAANEFTARMAAAQEEAKAALERAAQDMSRYYDQHRSPAPTYSIGDKVWLSSKNIVTDRPTAKLADKWLGPYPIASIVSRSAVRLQLPNSMKVHPVFNVTMIRPHEPDPILNRQPAPTPPPIIAGPPGEEEWEVERIDDVRRRYRKLQFLVKWKGWSNADRTWEPVENLERAPEAIAEFYRIHPTAMH
jgi:hypothetical protein